MQTAHGYLTHFLALHIRASGDKRLSQNAKAENHLLIKGIYPNPANQNLNIISGVPNTIINIYNNFGQKVYSCINSGLQTIDISSWAKGIYMVEMQDDSGSKKETSKLIIE